jgi:hypothetical protein
MFTTSTARLLILIFVLSSIIVLGRVSGKDFSGKDLNLLWDKSNPKFFIKVESFIKFLAITL